MINSDLMDSGAVFSGTTSNNSEDKQSVDERSYASNPRGHPTRSMRGGATSSRRPANGRRSGREAGEAKVHLDDVRPLWLDVCPGERYLLLEDQETGDVLMPLIYMKGVFEANYSRKLSSMKHRIVSVPPNSFLGQNRKATNHLCWIWAFESPQNVKLVVRKELGEEGFPQGHLRLVLLPIVYNAMCQKAQMRERGLFKKLRAAMRASSYWQLLNQVPETADPTPSAQGDSADMLFSGPKFLEDTHAKYMMPVSDATESEGGGKRTRQQYMSSQEAGVQGGVSGGSQSDAALMELREEFQRYKQETEIKITSLHNDLVTCKSCMYQVYNVLMPGGAQPPTATLQAPHMPAPIPTPSQPSILRPGPMQRRGSSSDIPSEFMPPAGALDAMPMMQPTIVPDGAGGAPVGSGPFPAQPPVLMPHDSSAYVPQHPPGPMHPFPFPGAMSVPGHILPPVVPGPGHPLSRSFAGPPVIPSAANLMQMSQQLSLATQVAGPGAFYTHPPTGYTTPPGPGRGM